MGSDRASSMDCAHRIPQLPLRPRSAVRAGPRRRRVPGNPPDLPSEHDPGLRRSPVSRAPQGALAFVLPERDRRRLPVPTSDDLKCVGAGMAQIDVAEIARIIADLDLSEPVALGDENAEPRRIVVDRDN